jgi:hypothetical protein
MAAYGQRRDRAARPGYELNAQLATLEPPAGELARVLESACTSQPEADRFLGVLAGAIPVEEFFSEETLAEATRSLPV